MPPVDRRWSPSGCWSSIQRGVTLRWSTSCRLVTHGSGGRCSCSGIAVHGLGDEIRSPPQSQVLPRCPGVGDPRVDRCNASVVFAVLRRFPQELWRAAELPRPPQLLYRRNDYRVIPYIAMPLFEPDCVGRAGFRLTFGYELLSKGGFFAFFWTPDAFYIAFVANFREFKDSLLSCLQICSFLPFLRRFPVHPR